MMNRKDEWVTAEDLMNRLKNDPDYQRRMAEKQDRQRIRHERILAAEQPILDDLRAAGCDVSSLDEIVNSPMKLEPGAVNVLLSHLGRCTENTVKEFIVRSLAAAQEPFDGTELAKCYETTKDDENVRWVILNTISLVPIHSIDAWIDKICENPVLKQELKKLGYRRR